VQSFTDAKGRAWEVAIDIPTAERVEHFTDLNILDSDGAQGLVDTIEDPLALARVLYAVCKEQADAQGIDRLAFLAGIVGDALDGARHALQEAIVAFFPPRRRKQLMAIRQQMRQVQELQAAASLGLTSTSSQAPSASSPSED